MSEREKQIRLFRRAAIQRLTTAEFLRAHTDFNVDAVYLAGYAIECALKALILQSAPRSQSNEMLRRLTKVGSKGHDYEYLKSVLKEQRGATNKTDREVLGELGELVHVVSSWSTDMRYQVGTLSPNETREFLQAARAIQELCARS